MALLINNQALLMNNSASTSSTTVPSSIRLTNRSSSSGSFSCQIKNTTAPRMLVIRNELSSSYDSSSSSDSYHRRMPNRSSSKNSSRTGSGTSTTSTSSSDAHNSATTTTKTNKQVVEDLERLFRLPSSPRRRYIDDEEDCYDDDSFTGGGFSSYGRGYRRRPTIKVVYQGVRGSYCQEAAVKAFSGNISNVDLLSSCSTGMEDAFRALEDRSADRAIIPIENSVDGTIDRNLDLLLRHGENVEILGELIVPVNHCLLAGTNKSVNIRRIVSHPQALSHCKSKLLEYKSYLNSIGCDLEVIEVENAADAARFVSENGILDTAVIGSRVAAEEFGLQIVEENIQDISNSGNFNRFLELGLKNTTGTSSSGRGMENRKTTVAFALEKGVSDMHKALSIFERANINVTRVEHRPNRSNPVVVKNNNHQKQPPCSFDYVFILDLETAEERKLMVALSELEKISGELVHVLGSNYTCRSSS